MFDVFLAMAEIAHPVIRSYAADFYLHDAKVLATMKPGDVAIWKPRESGSCLIMVARGRIANEIARESFKAASAIYGGDGWYLIDTDINGNWTLEAESDPAALIATYDDKTADTNRHLIRRGITPKIVHELHM